MPPTCPICLPARIVDLGSKLPPTHTDNATPQTITPLLASSQSVVWITNHQMWQERLRKAHREGPFLHAGTTCVRFEMFSCWKLAAYTMCMNLQNLGALTYLTP